MSMVCEIPSVEGYKNMNQRTSGLNFANYVSDEGKKIFFYKIGLIGPSRVGKTSIVAALLDEAKAALAQSYVSIAPFVDEDYISPTKERIRNTILDIEAGLDFSTFEPTGRGTADPFIFDLVMTIATGEEEAQLRLAILDYPGGWLENPPQGRQKEWDNCQQWIQESSVIIVPIDANLIMEADNMDRAKASRELLEVSRVEELVGGWAKGRWSKGESGLLLFAPVKCETYFDDNGGKKNKSEELYKRICKYYISVIEAAKQEMSEKEEATEETTRQNDIVKTIKQKLSPPKPSTYTIEYHPVDTIGCIELATANWEYNDKGELTLNCQYLVRNGNNFAATRKPLGAIGLLNSICKQMVENRQNSGIFRRFGDWFLGTDKLLANAINKLSQQKPGSRFKQIASGNIAKRG